MWNLKKTHQTEKQRTEVGGGGRGSLMRVVKRHKLPVTRYISTRDVMYNMINIMNTAVCCI